MSDKLLNIKGIENLMDELSDSGWPNEALIASIIRGERVLMPDGSSKIEVSPMIANRASIVSSAHSSAPQSGSAA